MSKPKIVPNKSDLDFITFAAGEEQRLVKARFWELVNESPALDAASMSSEAMCQLCGGAKLRGWLQRPEFRSWFFNQNLAKQKLQAAAEGAIDTLVTVMADDDPRTASSRVKAAETVLKYAGYEPPKQTRLELADKEVQNMDEDELREYIDKSLKKQGYKKLKEGQ